MARNLTMGELVRRCKRRAGLEFTSPISDPEWKALISEQYGHLYSIVVKSGFRYFEANPPQTIAADGSASYALPSDHDCTIGIDRSLDGNGTVTQLDELMIAERDALSGQTGDACYYSVVGQTIVLFPKPTSGTYSHLYVPQSPDISTLPDANNVDLVTADGESFLIYGVAVKAMAKTEQDPSLAMAERDSAERRFTEDVGLRALVNPRRRVVRPTPLEWEWGYDW
jgi:hypothetical protein